MKTKKLTAVIAILLVLATAGISNQAQARESYAGRGALIGGVVGAGGMSYLFYDFAENFNPGGGADGNGSTSSEKATAALFGVLVGGAVGAGFGALIGWAVPKKESRITVAPLMINSRSEGRTAGGLLQVKF